MKYPYVPPYRNDVERRVKHLEKPTAGLMFILTIVASVTVGLALCVENACFAVIFLMILSGLGLLFLTTVTKRSAFD